MRTNHEPRHAGGTESLSDSLRAARRAEPAPGTRAAARIERARTDQ